MLNDEIKKKSLKKNESIYLISQTYCSSYVTEIISKTNYNGRVKFKVQYPINLILKDKIEIKKKQKNNILVNIIL